MIDLKRGIRHFHPSVIAVCWPQILSFIIPSLPSLLLLLPSSPNFNPFHLLSAACSPVFYPLDPTVGHRFHSPDSPSIQIWTEAAGWLEPDFLISDCTRSAPEARDHLGHPSPQDPYPSPLHRCLVFRPFIRPLFRHTSGPNRA
jgi:hypothetical protein